MKQGKYDTIGGNGLQVNMKIKMIGKPVDIELEEEAIALQKLHVQNFREVSNDADAIAKMYPDKIVCHTHVVKVTVHVVPESATFETSRV